MAEVDEAAVHLARELIYYAGHGYAGQNHKRYPMLVALPQVAGRLPVSATVTETANHIDSVLIEAIRWHQNSITPRFSGREIPLDELRVYWTKILGLPPFPRSGELENHRRAVSDALGGGSIAKWRRRGGPEEEFLGFLAAHLLSPPGPLGGGSWVVRRSGLHYFIGSDRSIKRIDCRYDAETLQDGVTTFGVDHKSEAEGVVAEYIFIEGSVLACDGVKHKRLNDKTLSLDLQFDKSLSKGERRTLGYDLGVSTLPEGIQRLRLNASVVVWEHQLEVTFTEGILPDRIWWFANHTGTGVGEEPADDRNDLVPTDLKVRQSFAGLRQGPDYGIAFRWEKRREWMPMR